VCRSKHVEPSINFGIINSITKLHLVGISTESTKFYCVARTPGLVAEEFHSPSDFLHMKIS
jgi:hypothetical protein